jgi:hypothetical protein
MISVQQLSQAFSRGFFALALVIGVQTAYADTTQNLLVANSDVFAGNYQLALTANSDGKAIAIRYSSPTEHQTFPIGALASGMVLLNDSGRDILVLQGASFDPNSGGELKLVYLMNGITGRHGSVDIAIERTGGVWQMLANDSAGRRVVTSAFFKANHFFGKLVGISSVTFQ